MSFGEAYGGVIDPDTSAALAQTAAGEAEAAMVRAAASAKAAAGSAGDAAASQAAITALLAGLGVPHRWSGTVLQIRLPDGSYGDAVDLGSTVPGPPGITPSIQVGNVPLGSVVRQPASPDAAPVFDFYLPKGDKGDKGDTGAAGPSSVSFVARSTTSLAAAVGPVSIVLTPDTAAAFVPTQYVALTSASDPTAGLSGTLAGWDQPSGTLRIAVDRAAGSSTHADWIVTPSPPVFVPTGIDGGYAGDPVPPAGSSPVYGVSSSTSYVGVDGGFA